MTSSEQSDSASKPSPGGDSWDRILELRERLLQRRGAAGLWRFLRRLGAGALAASLVVTASTVALVLMVAPAAAGQLWPQCSVTYSGSSASVEFTGIGAGGLCQQYAWRDPRFHPGTSSGQVLCRFEASGVTATVRDRDPQGVTGGGVCLYLLLRLGQGAGL